MASKTNVVRVKTSWNGKELLEAEETPVNWLVEDILPQGFGIIAGNKKIGKSFLVLQASISIAVPKIDFLGYKAKTGRVLYVSLEGSHRQIKRRMTRMVEAMGITDTSYLSNLEIEENWRKLNKGGFSDLLDRLEKKKYLWVIIDTWQKAFEIKNQNDASDISKVVDPLYEITRAGELSFTFVDHFHKPNQFSGDIVNDIAGSGVKGGVADTVWGLTRSRGKQDARLDIASRETEIDGIDIYFSKEKGIWVPKIENELKPGTNQAKIMDAIKSSQEELWIREISRQTGIDASLVSREISELVNKGLIEIASNKVNGKTPYRAVKNNKNVI